MNRVAGNNPSERLGHAALDVASRDGKARKIEALLRIEPRKEMLRVLEIGTGSGGIAHYFGTHPSLSCKVDAVDVRDTRQTFDGYQFTKVDGVALPFEDNLYDIVISNHVIEHVGETEAQALHLAEIRRVLNPRGLDIWRSPIDGKSLNLISGFRSSPGCRIPGAHRTCACSGPEIFMTADRLPYRPWSTC